MNANPDKAAPVNTVRSSGKPCPFLTDTELITACLAGDLPSWDKLLVRYESLIFAVGIRLGLSRTDAEDVFQNVCVSLYQNLGTLRDTTRLAGWLAATTRQEVWRLKRRRNVSLLSELADGESRADSTQQFGREIAPSPEEELIAVEEQHLVRQCLNHLSAECQQLLTLLYCEEPSRSYAEVAEHMAIPIGSIGPRRARCLQKLKKNLGELGF